MRRPVAIALFAFALACCSRPAESGAPVPAWLPRVPDGLGAPYQASAVVGVQDRRLRLPSGQTCLPQEPACAKPLAELGGHSLALALEVDGALRMADLSAPLAALAQALGEDGQGCLVVADSQGRRCVRFRPFSGDDFSAWLDAEQPLAKVRVIMRADGLEIVANPGKVPGPDRFGPSLPTLGGRPDFDGLDVFAGKLKARFPKEDTAGLAPSPATPLAQAARVLAILNGPGGARFDRTFLVYP